MKCLSSRVYFGPHLYTCMDITHKTRADVVLRPGVLFSTEDGQIMTLGLKLSNHLHADFKKMSLQMPLVFARCIPKVCYLQEIYETRLWYQYVLYMLRYFKWKVWPDVGTTRSPTSLRLILEGTLICFTFNPAAVGLFESENIPYMYLLVVLEEKSEDRLSPLARSSGDHECFYKMPQQSIWKSLRYLSLD